MFETILDVFSEVTRNSLKYSLDRDIENVNDTQLELLHVAT